jgi:hypothetical protein
VPQVEQAQTHLFRHPEQRFASSAFGIDSDFLAFHLGLSLSMLQLCLFQQLKKLLEINAQQSLCAVGVLVNIIELLGNKPKNP